MRRSGSLELGAFAVDCFVVIANINASVVGDDFSRGKLNHAGSFLWFDILEIANSVSGRCDGLQSLA